MGLFVYAPDAIRKLAASLRSPVVFAIDVDPLAFHRAPPIIP
jgi:hypothetical protein